MKATLVRGVNASPYSVKNVDRNSMMNVVVTREPEKEFDIDAALELLRNKIRQIKKFFPTVDTTNLEESLDLTEKDLRQCDAYVREGKPTISASVRNAKEFVRAFTVEDLRLGLMNTGKRFPGMSVENCLKTLEREQPALVRAAKQLENESSWDLEAAGTWRPAKRRSRSKPTKRPVTQKSGSR